MGGQAYHSLLGFSSSKSQAAQVMQPVVMMQEEDWRQACSEVLRVQMTMKIVHGLFPETHLVAVHDRRLFNLVSFAKKVEDEMFALANSLNEYYQLIDEQIHQIMLQHEEIRQARKRKQQQAQGVLN